jgi:hypothetical protein
MVLESFEVLTTVKMSLLAFWVVTPCGLVGRYLTSARKMEVVCSPETWYLLTSPYGVATQKINIGSVSDLGRFFGTT